MVGTLKAELEKKRFEICCYIRRAEASVLTTAEMESDRARSRMLCEFCILVA